MQSVTRLTVASYKHFRSFVRLSICAFRTKGLKVKITKSEQAYNSLFSSPKGAKVVDITQNKQLYTTIYHKQGKYS